MPHKPVLLEEVLHYLNPRPGMIVVDGTLGSAGHAAALAGRIQPNGTLIGLDQDPQAIERARIVLKDFRHTSIHRENFRHLDKVLDTLNISNVDAVLLDVGLSSDQLEEDQRGFSFEREGPLDMRMDPAASLTARDIVNDSSQEDLEKLFRELADERQARRFARVICETRQTRPFETTTDLAQTICGIFSAKRNIRGSKKTWWFRRHPATRVFQALRIAVNDELRALREALPTIWARIKGGGRLAVITFHSLEDRIVKYQFRAWKDAHEAVILTKKPVTPSRQELEDNARARSAKLRVVEKIHEGTR
ncbi:MAG TPA: 16S rRNA (cytosine(1402)-N(4))-methyltransferase RsmH [bacterium]|nr:16S rRNA (cytosine(1402)-N(4))-methyltransferase RsmH [bacterium]